MNNRYNGKRAIIIGASSGIGRHLTYLLLNDGWQVGIAARRQEPLEMLQREYPEQVLCYRSLDVTTPSATTILRDMIDDLGGMDLFLYASGVGQKNIGLSPEVEEQTVQTNVLGFTRMVGEAYRYFAQQKQGHIAVISSIAGVRGLGPSPSYSATKAFQNIYLEALEQQSNSLELNIRFTDIRPGFIETDLLSGDKFPHTMSLDRASRLIQRAIYKQKHVAYIDTLWYAVVLMMRCVPRAIWRHLNLNK